MRKLSFLKKVVEAEADTLVDRAVRALSDEFDFLCLVRECKDLDQDPVHCMTALVWPRTRFSGPSEAGRQGRPGPPHFSWQFFL